MFSGFFPATFHFDNMASFSGSSISFRFRFLGKHFVDKIIVSMDCLLTSHASRLVFSLRDSMLWVHARKNDIINTLFYLSRNM